MRKLRIYSPSAAVAAIACCLALLSPGKIAAQSGSPLSIVSAGSYLQGIAPSSIASIFGQGLAPDVYTAQGSSGSSCLHSSGERRLR